MQSFQIVGTNSFFENIRELKLNDTILLIPNPDNKQNPKSVGLYTSTMKKIGYLPFNIDQIKYINIPCKITKLNLIQGNTIIIISRIIPSDDFVLSIENNSNIILDNTGLTKELTAFKKFLERNKNQIHLIGITFMDEDFIDIYIQTNNSGVKFRTVTKSYYDKYIIKYDEFYKIGLIQNSIYEPFKIHSLDSYIKKNYKLVTAKQSKITKPNNTIATIANNTITINDCTPASIAWNHEREEYCYIDMYNDDYCIINDNNYNNYEDILKVIKPRKLCIYDQSQKKLYYI